MGVSRVHYQSLCIGCLLSVAAGSAQSEISGYAKSLWLDTNTVIGEKESVSLSLNRWRLTWREQIYQAQFWISYDIEWRAGNYLDTFQYELQRTLGPEPYWDLQSRWHTSSDAEGYHGLYRAYVKLPIGPMDIRLGRQQLNWSQTYLWSSFDRFNPYNPLQLEPDERQGVDALQLVWNLQNSNSIEIASAGAQEARKESHGVRFRTHMDTIDVDYLLADFGGTNSVGIAAAGQWLEAGWRFEATTNRSTKDTDHERDRYNDLILSVDYTFPNEFTLIGELLYRGNGATRPQDYDWLALLSGERINLAQHYLGILFRKGFEPIAGVDVAWLYNLDEHSNVWAPTVRYSPGQFENLHFRSGLQLFNGSREEEFGRPENIVFAEVQWFY